MSVQSITADNIDLDTFSAMLAVVDTTPCRVVIEDCGNCEACCITLGRCKSQFAECETHYGEVEQYEGGHICHGALDLIRTTDNQAV